jgi:hypothetical protein
MIGKIKKLFIQSFSIMKIGKMKLVILIKWMLSIEFSLKSENKDIEDHF